MAKDILPENRRGPYNINHIDEAQKKRFMAKLSSPEYIKGAIDRIANKISDELVHRPEI